MTKHEHRWYGRQGLVIVCALLSALVCDGCVHAPAGAREPSSAELAAIHEADIAFREQVDRVDNERCDERFDVRILEADGDYFREQTTYCTPPLCAGDQVPRDCPNGCARATVVTYHEGVWPWVFLARSWKPLIVFWSRVTDVAERLRLIKHEWLHHLLLCETGDPDREHARREVWRLE